jgi:hypothetical protein
VSGGRVHARAVPFSSMNVEADGAHSDSRMPGRPGQESAGIRLLRSRMCSRSAARRDPGRAAHRRRGPARCGGSALRDGGRRTVAARSPRSAADPSRRRSPREHRVHGHAACCPHASARIVSAPSAKIRLDLDVASTSHTLLVAGRVRRQGQERHGDMARRDAAVQAVPGPQAAGRRATWRRSTRCSRTHSGSAQRRAKPW